MQFVDPTHDRQIAVRHRPRQIVDAAAADPELPRLGGQRQRMITVDHRFALGNRTAFPSAPAKKSFASVNSPLLACSTVKIGRESCRERVGKYVSISVVGVYLKKKKQNTK